MKGNVVDLFSCGGGMSAGFSGAFGFNLGAAVDLEVAKPSGKSSAETGCNAIYQANHGIVPLNADLLIIEPDDFIEREMIGFGETRVLISCAPCTDFSRANPLNHGSDRNRNTLVGRSGDYAEALMPSAFVMENARELLTGNHSHHWEQLRKRLSRIGMAVSSRVHKLSHFGLPQVRERAVVIAARSVRARSLDDLWEGWEISPEATTVRSALSRLAEWQRSSTKIDEDGSAFPGMSDLVRERIKATPKDGGGWIDVAKSSRFDLMTADCIRRYKVRDFGSHPDVYGRMAWDRPAPTIKRECGHTGNGRYLHPEADRLMTVREMATLQGFPFHYRFPSSSVSNRYRAIGDAVPPLIARQIAACVHWSLSGIRPDPSDWVLPDTTLRLSDLKRISGRPVTVTKAA